MSRSTARTASPSASPLGSLPSVSTVNEMTTCAPASRAASAMPVASGTFVSVIAVTRSASVSGSVRIWVEWYSRASSRLMIVSGLYASPRGPTHPLMTTVAANFARTSSSRSTAALLARSRRFPS
ncbi:hypothetical protein ND450_20975 [Lentzea sp. HUAS12]|nr:hypothetical protein [Lentzea sp. HUAS12]USX56478.1 hypothetical protein ND450_20975 [Lentzea sp. HUAS12]